ncbi:glycosyl transferase group 1 [Rhodopirellula maiorica SM1]|uniref:Glycosyl transferase group 1 n=1 Tax=Rhodopirellula maiorica SM1 TaxID=1265738 RepID=M5S0X2_9BACT|nr:glycosyltransferase family 4 protein [Rhodopirellula maiorica]EMI19804.1 glycosyl transferase group 1 [Rhodopirellula maiorica SM1]
MERYQHGICSAHANLGATTSALVQSRIEIENTHGYRVIPFASPQDSRRDRRKQLRQTITPLLANSRSATFVSHHASVSYHVTDLIGDHDHVVHFQGPWAEEAAVEGAPKWKTFLQRRQERKVYQSADRIITLSTAFKTLVVDRFGVDPDRVHVIPGAIDASAADPAITRAEARERLDWPADREIVLSIRRLCRRVGVDVLIQAAIDVVRNHPDVLFMIGGTGPLKSELESLIQQHQLQKNVRLLGFVADSDLQIAYRAADYSILPTQALEGFGLVTLESMATGTPSIVTPVGSLPEVVGPLSESLILPGKSADQIAIGLSEIFAGKRDIPGDEACREYVRSKYDWSVIAPRVLEVYRGSSS